MLLTFSNSRRSLTLSTAVALLALLVVVAGCGEEKEPVGAISGTVKSKGKTCGDCKIGIFNTATMNSNAAKVDSSGAFELKGIPYGNYQVKVYPMPTDTTEEIPDPRIPKKFRDFKKSGITISIDSEEPAVLEIDMK